MLVFFDFDKSYIKVTTQGINNRIIKIRDIIIKNIKPQKGPLLLPPESQFDPNRKGNIKINNSINIIVFIILMCITNT